MMVAGGRGRRRGDGSRTKRSMRGRSRRRKKKRSRWWRRRRRRRRRRKKKRRRRRRRKERKRVNCDALSRSSPIYVV